MNHRVIRSELAGGACSGRVEASRDRVALVRAIAAFGHHGYQCSSHEGSAPHEGRTLRTTLFEELNSEAGQAGTPFPET
jgi:hypothetical protein